MMILNEELYAKNILLGKHTEIKSVVKLIGYITRYNYYVLNKDDDINYRDTVRWLSNTQKNFDETYYSVVIANSVKYAAKNPFYRINSIEITESELSIIRSLDNLRAEKMLFVLLCMAKQQAIARGFTDGLVQYNMTDLCKTARISVPKDDREYILHNILKQGLISCPKKNNTKCLKINFINDDEPALVLNEMDCQELGYVYLNWKNKKGFMACGKCGRLFKIHKGQRLCQYCEESLNQEKKNICCIDCGINVVISNFNSHTCRCDKCQRIRDKILDIATKSDRNKRYYESHRKN